MGVFLLKKWRMKKTAAKGGGQSRARSVRVFGGRKKARLYRAAFVATARHGSAALDPGHLIALFWPRLPSRADFFRISPHVLITRMTRPR